MYFSTGTQRKIKTKCIINYQCKSLKLLENFIKGIKGTDVKIKNVETLVDLGKNVLVEMMMRTIANRKDVMQIIYASLLSGSQKIVSTKFMI